LNAAQRKKIIPRFLRHSETRAHALTASELYGTYRLARIFRAPKFVFILFIVGILSVGIIKAAPALPHKLPNVTDTSLALAEPQPENTGVVTFDKSSTQTPATVVMAGDSLARGKGSLESDGMLKNIGYYLVNRANTVEPGIARYQVINGLSVDGSSVEDLTQRLQSQSDSLAKTPNLVLILSFTNRDLANFVLDAKNAQSTNHLAEFFQVARILHHDSTRYQHSLADLRDTLADIHAKREKLLGAKQASLQVVILGLPNEAYSPSIKATLHKYHIANSELSYVINVFNADDKNAAVLGNKEQRGVVYSFINLDRLHVPEKTALAGLSADQFHPNDKGYEMLANYVGQNVVMGQKNHSKFLANE
jgi:lysophospholipase L1-like esterase